MATGIINPYAVAAAPNTRYRDAVLADSPIGLWMLDEPYGNNVAANQGSLGSAYDGLYAGNIATDPLYRGSGTIFGLDAMGRNYYSNTTTGMYGSYVIIPSAGAAAPAIWPNNSSSSTSWSVEYIIRRTYNAVASQWEYIVQNWHPVIFYYFGYDQKVNIQSTNSTYKSAGGSGTYVRVVDYHIVWTFSGSNVRGYINGVWTWNTNWTSGYTGMQMTPYRSLMFGNGSTTQHFRGLMAGVAIHSSVLSQTQVTAHYNALL